MTDSNDGLNKGQALLTISEAGDEAKVGRQAIYVAIKKGRLKATLVKHRWLIDPADLEEYRLTKYSRENIKVDGQLVHDMDKGHFSVIKIALVLTEMLGERVSAQRVYYLINTGDLKASKRGSSWVIHKDDAISYYERHKQDRENPAQTRFA